MTWSRRAAARAAVILGMVHHGERGAVEPVATHMRGFAPEAAGTVVVGAEVGDQAQAESVQLVSNRLRQHAIGPRLAGTRDREQDARRAGKARRIAEHAAMHI